jgi:hypothetical protein
VANANAKTVYDYLRNAGMSVAGAFGIVANLVAESNVRPDALNASEDSHGIAQWHDTAPGVGRWSNLKKWAKSHNMDPNTLATQERYIVAEMQSPATRANPASPASPTLWERVRATTDSATATRLVLTRYERPKDQSESQVTKRMNAGKSALGGLIPTSSSAAVQVPSNLGDTSGMATATTGPGENGGKNTAENTGRPDWGPAGMFNWLRDSMGALGDTLKKYGMFALFAIAGVVLVVVGLLKSFGVTPANVLGSVK